MTEAEMEKVYQMEVSAGELEFMGAATWLAFDLLAEDQKAVSEDLLLCSLALVQYPGTDRSVQQKLADMRSITMGLTVEEGRQLMMETPQNCTEEERRAFTSDWIKDKLAEREA